MEPTKEGIRDKRSLRLSILTHCVRQAYIEELFEFIDGPVLDTLLQDLANPDLDVQDGVMLAEEVFFNLELRRVQTCDEDVDSDGVKQEVTQMNHKVIFDRWVE